MKYKGYIGKTEYDREENIFTASVVNADVVITGQGKSKVEAELMLASSIDDYLKWCEEDGVSPAKPMPEDERIEIEVELPLWLSEKAKEKEVDLSALLEAELKKQVEEPIVSVRIHMPRSLHKRLKEAAAVEGVSLNQYIIYKLA